MGRSPVEGTQGILLFASACGYGSSAGNAVATILGTSSWISCIALYLLVGVCNCLLAQCFVVAAFSRCAFTIDCFKLKKLLLLLLLLYYIIVYSCLLIIYYYSYCYLFYVLFVVDWLSYVVHSFFYKIIIVVVKKIYKKLKK